jgi:hypothetical protein
MQFRGPFLKSWRELVSILERKISEGEIDGIAVVARITMDGVGS